MSIMKYGILKYIDVIEANNKDNEIYANIGDFIQIHAMRKLYKEIGIKNEALVEIGLNELKSYKGEKVLMPLHFGLGYSNINKLLPVSKDIVPRFMSLTMIVDLFEDNNWLVEYFKKYEPIGCRDEKTKNIMLKYGIEAYLVGCATITIEKRKGIDIGVTNYLIDVPQKAFKYIPREIINNSVLVSHEKKIKKTLEGKEDYAVFDEQVKKQYMEYNKKAKLIISSRLHAVVPAIAMGIPCICITNSADMRFSWIDKYIRIYQDGEYEFINWKSAVVECEDIKKVYKKYFESTITFKDNRAEMEMLDNNYMDRKKSLYNKGLCNRIEAIKKNNKVHGEISYIIWGGGMHAYIVKELMQQYFPKAKLKVIVDKFEVGQRLGVDIINPNEVSEYKFDICVITTFAGKDEARIKLSNMGLKEEEDYFVVLSKTKTTIESI